MISVIRSVIFNIVLYTTGIIYGTLCLTFILAPKRARFHLVLLWVRFAMWWMRIACGIKITVIDHNDGPLKTPHVVLSKHQTMWETLFLQYYFLPISTIFKRSLLKIPFFGWGLSLLRPIPIDRSSPVKALKDVQEKGVRRIQEGLHVLVFPEGTRIPVGEAGNYARSGADIAKKAGVDIVPVAHNAGECWPAKQFTKHPGEIRVVIGKPISTEGLHSKVLTEEVKNWIEGEIAKMPPGRADAQRVEEAALENN
ncbi:1-acyl-sn-glycerol-3-phosphate acyltransferase [Aurantivibrio plasticivorans]